MVSKRSKMRILAQKQKTGFIRSKQNERKKHFFQKHTQKTNTNKTTKKHFQKTKKFLLSKKRLHFPKHKFSNPLLPSYSNQKKTKTTNKLNLQKISLETDTQRTRFFWNVACEIIDP